MNTELNISEYSRFIAGPINEKFRKAGEYNCDKLTWLKSIENYFNLKLIESGKVYLNDVYEALGIPKTNIGAKVGWKYDMMKPSKDNIINFGIEEDRNKDFINNGDTNVLLLDFNCNTVFTDLES